LFPDTCHAWQLRAIAGKTWAQFKIDFATAHREFRLTNQTAQQSGFHSANMMIEQGRDHSMGMVATLTTTNAKLANQLEAAHALIAQLKNEIATLKNKIKPAWQGQRPAKTTNNDSYCWSRGYQVAKSHTSATCNMKKNGHQDDAMKTDTMGGVQWGKEWCGGAANEIDNKLDHFALSLDFTNHFQRYNRRHSNSGLWVHQ
jgi:hypothetical protein